MNSPLSALAGAAFLTLVPMSHASVDVQEQPDRIRVEIGGKLFTELHLTGAPHVFYWPLIGPGGTKMTRSWPMEEPAGEEHDHPHHRSMWFSHGAVNGVDFWTEDTGPAAKTAKAPTGHIVHEKVLTAKGGTTEGVVSTAQKWVAPDGAIPLTSVQTLRIYERPESERLFDFEITLTAGGQEVTFGDTKEGSFGVRIAESMRLKGPKNTHGQGHILNSEGLKEDKAWGQRAKWVDMYGPVGDRTLGIAIFDHPSNLRHPTRWHARDYGLFAANPFCEHEMDKTQPAGAGAFKLAAGQSTTFRYRVLIHEGEPDAAKLADQFSAFTKKDR